MSTGFGPPAWASHQHSRGGRDLEGTAEVRAEARAVATGALPAAQAVAHAGGLPWYRFHSPGLKYTMPLKLPEHPVPAHHRAGLRRTDISRDLEGSATTLL